MDIDSRDRGRNRMPNCFARSLFVSYSGMPAAHGFGRTPSSPDDLSPELSINVQCAVSFGPDRPRYAGQRVSHHHVRLKYVGSLSLVRPDVSVSRIASEDFAPEERDNITAVDLHPLVLNNPDDLSTIGPPEELAPKAHVLR